VALASHLQDQLVLKKALGYAGEDVIVGRFTKRPVWQKAVQKALIDGGWLLQEYVSSRPYPFQAGDEGVLDHDVVWGLFCFDRRYGGGFLRMNPRGSGDGVINSHQGAVKGLLLEV